MSDHAAPTEVIPAKFVCEGDWIPDGKNRVQVQSVEWSDSDADTILLGFANGGGIEISSTDQMEVYA